MGLDHGLVGVLFSQAYSSIIPRLDLNPNFIPLVEMFSKVEFKAPFELFWFPGQIKWRPYNLLLDPSSKTNVDNAATSLLNISYLVSSRPSVLIFQNGQKKRAEVYRRTQFSRQLGYR